MPNCQLDKPWTVAHALLLQSSYQRLFGKPLLNSTATGAEFAAQLFNAPFALASHNTDPDPLFNYANACALQLFEFDITEFVTIPSRFSAEPVNREERAQLLAQVTQHGYIDHYQGIRISKSGRRFEIRNATVWNIVDEHHVYRGQAACFQEWQFL